MFGNGIAYLISQFGYRAAKRAGRSMLALFFFLLCIMNAGNLLSYIPTRTFANHADMATVERGLRISPWWIAIVLGIPFCVAVAHLVLKTLPDAMRYLFRDTRAAQAALLILCCFMIFAYYGGVGFHGYGSISHAISLVSIGLLLPLAVIYDWPRTRRESE